MNIIQIIISHNLFKVLRRKLNTIVKLLKNYIVKKSIINRDFKMTSNFQENFRKNALLKSEASEALSHLQNNLLQIPQVCSSLQLNDASLRYIRLGVLRRYLTIEKDWRWIILNLPIDRKIGLSTVDTQEAALHLNSLYLHALGVLDNFAWAFIYQANFEQASSINRIDVGLFKKKIQDFLPEGLEKEKIKGYFEWYKDVSGKRHPVAHRLPLYIPPQVLLSEKEKEQKKKLDLLYKQNDQKFMEQFAKVASEDNSTKPIQLLTSQMQELNDLEKEHEERQQAINVEISNLGTFVPGFMYPEEDILYPIYPDVTQDVKKLASLTDDCLLMLSKISKE